MSIEKILDYAISQEASDIHITAGRPASIRLHGTILSIDNKILGPKETLAFATEITSEEQRKQVEEMGGIDFGFSFADKARFRVSCFKQKGSYAMVLRRLPYKFFTFEELGLPVQLIDLLSRPRGLILVTGPTGSGKTTSLATMLNYINENYETHIITIEDPIEFIYPHKKSIVTQREVGADVTSFSEALVKALRQDPDVILVGEMRDLPTMEAAIRAAETGHLVFSTLHTTGAARTVDRIVDVFPTNQQTSVRIQLASTIVAVISQSLIPRMDGKGRVCALEIMIATPAIRNLIREGKTYQITTELQTGARFGMRALDDHLLELYRNNVISYDSMLEYSQDSKAVAEQAAKAPTPPHPSKASFFTKK